MRRRFRIPVTVFQRISTSPMPRKLPLPFGIGTTVFQAHSSARSPSRKAAWIRPMSISHFKGYGKSFRLDARSQAQICSALMPDGLTAVFRHRWWTAPATSLYSGINSSIGNGYSATSMLLPGGVGYTVQFHPLLHHPRNGNVFRREGALFGLAI